MREVLMKKLMALTDEERKILSGMPIDERLYFSDRALIKSERMLGKQRSDIGIKSHPRYAAFPEHGHNFVEMMIVLGGEITHHIGDREIKLCEGEVLLLDKHVRHSIDRAGEGDLGVNIIMADRFISSLMPELMGTVLQSFLEDNAAKDGKGAFLHFALSGDGQAENLIENIIYELTEPHSSNAILARTIALFFCYLSEKSALLTEASTPSDTDSERKAHILAYIKSNYRTANLSELGGELFLSLPYLSRLIASYFGKSFKELLIDERMRRADILITETDMPISEIIRSVGYENVSYFHREYKRRTGVVPLARRAEGRAK